MTNPVENLLPRLNGVRQIGDRWEACCPCHDDQQQSLCISRGDDGRALVHCQAGCEVNDIIETVGLTMRNLFSDNGRNGNGQPKSVIVKTYDYRDETDKLLFQVCRMEPKDFRQRRPKSGGGWEWKVKGVRQVPYRLDLLAKADPSEMVFVDEGEKDVDRLIELDLLATCNAGGATKGRCKWKESHSECLAGRRVVILPDNDNVGRKHAQKVAMSLHGKATSIKIITLPGLPEKGDISDWLDAGHTKDELLELAAAAPEWESSEEGGEPHADGEIVVGTDEGRVIDEAIAALASQKNVYERGGNLVHIVKGSKPPKGISRPEESPRIVPMRFPRIRELLADARAWYRPSGDGDRDRGHPPEWVVKAVDARGKWPGVQRLEAVVESPVLRADGTVLQKPGYDAETGIFFQPQCQFPSIPAKPSHDDAVHARDQLLEVVEDFPFADDSHRAAWVAGVLTPMSRYAYSGPSPAFLNDANIRGCGKSLLTDITSIIATGREMARMTLPRDDDELRKRITAMAMMGEPLILIDNIVGTFGSPSLNAALTATVWSDRILGQTTISILPLYATWYATGNNIVLGADTARRVVHIRLESPEESPESRTGFKHADLLAWVRRERPRLTSAAITILAAYCHADRPDMNLTPWGSFEGWSDLVRQAVVWVGLSDPGASRTDLASQADREAVALRQLIEGWEEIDPSSAGMTVATILQELAAYPTHHEGLKSALFELAPPKDGKTLNPRSIGMKLHHLRRRVVGGKFFDRRDSSQGAIWKVYTSDQGGTNGSRGTTPSLRGCAHAHAHTHITPEGTEISPSSASSPTPPNPCPHTNVAEEPTFDGFVNRICRDCGERLYTKRKHQT